jgi:hypothetical protein
LLELLGTLGGLRFHNMVIVQLIGIVGHDLEIRQNVLYEKGYRPSPSAYAVLKRATKFLRGQVRRFEGALSLEFIIHGRVQRVELHHRRAYAEVEYLPTDELASAIERLIPVGLR